MRKRDVVDIIFFIGYFLLLLTDVCQRVPIIANNDKYITICAYALIVLYILVNFRKYKDINNKIKLLYVLCIFIAIIAWFYNKNFTVLRLLLIIMAIYNMDFDEIIKKDIVMKITITALLILFPLLGVIEQNYLLRSDLSVRYAFGFNHPNSLSIYLIMITFESFYLQSRKNNKIVLKLNMIITPLLIAFIFIVTNSRMSALVLLVFYLLNIINLVVKNEKKNKFYSKNINKKIVCNLFGFFTLLTILSIILAYNDTKILRFLDSLFSNRYSNYLIFIKKYGITLFGKAVPVKIGYGEFLDSMYLKLLINQGILQYFLYYGVYLFTTKKIFENQNTMLMIIIFSVMIEGFTETNMIIPTINIFMIYFATNIKDIRKENQIEDEKNKFRRNSSY